MIHQGCVAGFIFPISQVEAKPLEKARGYCRRCGRRLPKRKQKFCSEECRLAHKRELNRGYMRERRNVSRRMVLP